VSRLRPRVTVDTDRPIWPCNHHAPASGRVTTTERVGSNLVDTIATVAILKCEFFEIFYTVNELGEVRPYGNSVGLVQHFTYKTTRVDCNGSANLE
jgi:hypothetical protein